MLPLWVQWLFAGGFFVLIAAAFGAIWSRLGKIEKRIGGLEGQLNKSATEEKDTPSP